MALIVEDGTGVTDSESYCSVVDADAWHAARGITLWAPLLEAEKEQALRRATDYMTQAYRPRWVGSRVEATQSLDWPRNGVYVDGVEVAANIVPKDVRNACAELAFKAASGDLSPDLTRSQYTTREKVDVIEVEYSPGTPAFKVYRSINNMIAPFLRVGGSGVARLLVRS